MDIELFQVYLICFSDRTEFDKAMELNHLAVDIGHSDMVLVYDNEVLRDEIERYLRASDVETI